MDTLIFFKNLTSNLQYTLYLYHFSIVIEVTASQFPQRITVYVRFQVLTAASMMFRVVFWDIMQCKITNTRRWKQ
jgi:hypothetical protein